METHLPADIQAIRHLNDRLRQTRLGGMLVLSTGIAELGDLAIGEILSCVATFEGFTPDNDPFGEHDCAIVDWGGHRVLFKIDYFDPTLQFHSDDPADPILTRRVMTVMLASE